ncbi:unnamed protein product, partial [Musa hybrid cultivar]
DVWFRLSFGFPASSSLARSCWCRQVYYHCEHRPTKAECSRGEMETRPKAK